MDANALYAPQKDHATRAADAAAIAAGSPLALDLSAISGGTTQKGETITDSQAVASFVVKPPATRIVRAGVADRTYVRGDFKPHLSEGAGQERVYNGTAASVTLAVGTPLAFSPTNDYLVPLFINPTAGGTTKTLLSHGGHPVAIVTKAATLTTLQTALVNVYVFPPVPPVPFMLAFAYEAAADVPTAGYAFIAPAPGCISRAGIGARVGGSAGGLLLDVLIDAVSIFTAAPTIVNDCTDPCHTLPTVDTAVATLLGSSTGKFGTIDQTKCYFLRNSLVTFTVDKTSWNGTGAHIQIDGEFY